MTTVLNGREIVDMQVDGIDMRDYPDFCDAFISEAYYADTGEALTDDDLDTLNDDSDLVYSLVESALY